jgi:hypothetical protein
MMTTLITVGTDDGLWAPPKEVELAVMTATPSGLGITNAEAVGWRLIEPARIVAAAIQTGTGDWARVDITALRVAAHQDVVIAARALHIDVNLPTLAADQIRAPGLLVAGTRGRQLPGPAR